MGNRERNVLHSSLGIVVQLLRATRRDASSLDRMDVSRSGANSQALRKGRSPGRALHRRAVVATATAVVARRSRYSGPLTPLLELDLYLFLTPPPRSSSVSLLSISSSCDRASSIIESMTPRRTALFTLQRPCVAIMRFFCLRATHFFGKPKKSFERIQDRFNYSEGT